MKPGLVLTAVLCLCAAAPPGWFWGAGLLVLPGWMAFYALIQASRRPKLGAYLIGVVHLLSFSFSLVHSFWMVYPLIALVGGLYYLLAVVWTRALDRFVPGALAFGCALCGITWLRSYMPGIYYPHAQPAHCLYHWPWLMGSVGWGSEVLLNLLLGMLAAGIVDLYRAWRLAKPPFKRSAWWLGGTAVVFLGLTLPPPRPSEPDTLRVVLIEPSFSAEELRKLNQEDRLIAAIYDVMMPPTLRLAGARVATPPDLVVWPEAIALHHLQKQPGNNPIPMLGPQDLRLPLHPDTRLLVGTFLYVSEERIRVAALLMDGAGNYAGHHEKIHLVPGGEFQPWYLRWLAPFFRGVFGLELSDYVLPGRIHSYLLSTQDGTEFAAMICYDNAFPDVCRDYADMGARFFVVLSNECWYEGGNELDQMVAMTVCRALETGRPVIRCTVNGVTMGVDGNGRVLGRLVSGRPRAPGAGARARVLRLQVPLPAGGPMAMAWLHVLLPWLVLATALVLMRPLARSWGTLSNRWRGPASAGP